MELFTKKDKNSKEYKLNNKDIKELLNWIGPDGCLATDRITVNGCRVGYMYREKPDNDIDSGWRFFEGTEDEEYTNNPNNIGIYRLNTICNYDKDIIPFLNAKYGTAYIRDENGKFVEDKYGEKTNES